MHTDNASAGNESGDQCRMMQNHLGKVPASSMPCRSTCSAFADSDRIPEHDAGTGPNLTTASTQPEFLFVCVATHVNVDIVDATTTVAAIEVIEVLMTELKTSANASCENTTDFRLQHALRHGVPSPRLGRRMH